MLQILFLSGVALTIGLKSTLEFFTKPQNFKVLFSTIPLISLLSLSFSASNYSLLHGFNLGNNIVWGWFLLCCYWLAYYRHAVGIVWIHCAFQVCLHNYFSYYCFSPKITNDLFLQWVLAYYCSFCTEDTYSRLGVATSTL